MDILLAVGSVLGVAAALAIDWYEDEFIWCGDDDECFCDEVADYPLGC